jgi:phosphomannomutase
MAPKRKAADTDLEARVRPIAEQYIKWDPNPETRSAVQKLLDADDFTALEKSLSSRLEFGTAGLRGPMTHGYNAMNDLTVVQATQGVALYLEQCFGEEAKAGGVAIGWDHRAADSLSSERFALLAAEVLIRRGIRVALLPGLVHTPMVSYCVSQRGCKAGIMVTASHNPRADDGYKVYWSNGAQIIPPHDSGIAKCIDESLAPWCEDYGAGISTPADLLKLHGSTMLGGKPIVASHTQGDLDLAPGYFEQMRSELCRYPAENAKSDLKVVYTAMHGVGAPWFKRGFKTFGLAPPIPVAAQDRPDPTFPTVAFPNPEEGKGALELAFKTAEESGASLVLANDPDADRLAVAEQRPDGTWRVLTGNEIGVLFADWELRQYKARAAAAAAAGEPIKPAAMLSSAVSSHMMQALAKEAGCHWEETLTGFKWLCSRGIELRNEGYEIIMSYEEAIGFCLGSTVNDKDGVSAGAAFAEMAACLRREQAQSVVGHLESLYAKYGQYVMNASYIYSRDPKVTAKIFTRMRAEFGKGSKVGGVEIAGVRDLTTGVDTDEVDGRAKLPLSSSSHMITYKLANGATATLRGSGTEPKIKWYVELVGEDRAATSAQLDALVASIIEEMLQPSVNSLEFRAA